MCSTLEWAFTSGRQNRQLPTEFGLSAHSIYYCAQYLFLPLCIACDKTKSVISHLLLGLNSPFPNASNFLPILGHLKSKFNNHKLFTYILKDSFQTTENNSCRKQQLG